MKSIMYEDLYMQYKPMIQSIISELHVQHDYAHFEQIGRVALWQAQQRFTTGDASTFGAFVYVKVRGAMLDEFRRNARYAQHSVLVETFPTVAVAPYDIDVKELMEEALAHVSTADGELFRLLYVEQYTLKEVSELWDMPYKTVTRRHARLMHKLRAVKAKLL
ncbi:RNA polymerase sigma factor SigS [Metalysinibacillus saudimassiliensis]|uniref:RNA polymerase sigma factor SigS n=1 Tax=Metalysinibacillus saudimassiliensis TaxID=1461583 RepID=A0A078M662_9BACL|nr:RNA polymerase sigma factor SigS [Metalysinibacillus saudimassiliensis]